MMVCFCDKKLTGTRDDRKICSMDMKHIPSCGNTIFLEHLEKTYLVESVQWWLGKKGDSYLDIELSKV